MALRSCCIRPSSSGVSSRYASSATRFTSSAATCWVEFGSLIGFKADYKLRAFLLLFAAAHVHGFNLVAGADVDPSREDVLALAAGDQVEAQVLKMNHMPSLPGWRSARCGSVADVRSERK